MNEGEAERCAEMAGKAFRSGDHVEAERLLKKSMSLHPTDLAQKLSEEMARHSSPASSKTPNSERPPISLVSQLWRLLGFHPPIPESERRNIIAVDKVLACRNYYEVLDISPGASAGEIKRAYFRSALMLHPDKNSAKGADEAFKVLSKAYDTLKESESKEAYDRDLSDGRGQINTDHLKRVRITRFTKEEDGWLIYTVGQLLVRDILLGLIWHRVLSPCTWPWADPVNLGAPLLLGSLLLHRTIGWNMGTSLAITGIGLTCSLYGVYLMFDYPFVSVTFYSSLVILTIPHFHFLKNRLRAHWVLVTLALISLYVVWRFILGPFLYSLIVLAIFTKCFSLDHLIARSKWACLALFVVVYLVCDSVIAQVLRMLFFVMSVCKMIAEAKNLGSTDETDHEEEPTHGHSHNGAPCSHSHAHSHSHSRKAPQHGHSHNGKPCKNKHSHDSPSSPNFSKGEIRFGARGKVFLRRPGSHKEEDITREYHEYARTHNPS